MFCSRTDFSVAVLGDVLYAMGGYGGYAGSSEQNTAERYDSKKDRWSLIAPMKVKRWDASATALNGNMNIMKQEGICAKCVVK
jgi:N-acetylneuraminic acid mutarotase